MTEKTEWEVVDEPTQAKGSNFKRGKGLQDLMSGLLGRWWRWKVAGASLVGIVAFAIVATLSIMLVLLMTAGAVLALGIAKIRQWLHGGKTTNSYGSRVVVRAMQHRRH